MFWSSPILARLCPRSCVTALLAFLAVLAAPAFNAAHVHADDFAQARPGHIDDDTAHAAATPDPSGPSDDAPSDDGHQPPHDSRHCATCSVIAAFASATSALADAPLAIFEHRTHWLRPTDVAAPVRSHPHLTSAAPRGPPAFHA